MRFYDYNPDNADKLVLKLDAEYKNLQAEYTVLEAVEAFEYSGKVFNRRYETQLHKHLGDLFGRVPLEGENYRGETEHNRVCAYMHDEGTSYSTGKKRYSVNITFTGYRVGRDYDTKTEFITEKPGEAWKFYTVTSAEEVKQQAAGRLEAIERSMTDIKLARTKVKSLIKEHNDIRAKLEAFNDKVPYILAEELRIR